MSSQDRNVLSAGSGPIMLSLVEACYEHGMSKVAVFVTNAQSTDTVELVRLSEYALHSNPDASLDMITAADESSDWRSIVRPFQFVLYVSQHGDPEELRQLQDACLAEKKPILPAMIIKGMGLAGPLLHPDGDGRWESAWRRIHSTVFPADRDPQLVTITSSAILSNLIVFEWHITVTGENEPACRNQCYILDPVTLRGSWHPVIAHPLVSGHNEPRPVDILHELETGRETTETEEWFSCFSRLTSEVTGIFHVWEEGDLYQLPLAQCLVQPVDPLSEGPARLLPAIVCSGLTHEEARRESGLAGLEAYIARMLPLFGGLTSNQHAGLRIGAGCTCEEAIERGLRVCLAEQLSNRTLHDEPVVTVIECTRIEDVRCRYYLQALSIEESNPLIAVGEPLHGFPVVWVRAGDCWYGSVDFSLTLAFRQSLQKALMKTERISVSSVLLKDIQPPGITISSGDPPRHASWMLLAIKTLEWHGKRLEVFDLRCESFLREGPFAVYGVLIGEEEGSHCTTSLS